MVQFSVPYKSSESERVDTLKIYIEMYDYQSQYFTESRQWNIGPCAELRYGGILRRFSLLYSGWLQTMSVDEPVWRDSKWSRAALPMGPVPSLVTVILRKIYLGKFVALTCKPKPLHLPVLYNFLSDGLYLLWDIAFCPGGIEYLWELLSIRKKIFFENPHRHLPNSTDCFLLNSCWVLERWLSAFFFFNHPYDTSKFSKLFALTYQLFILYAAALEYR